MADQMTRTLFDDPKLKLVIERTEELSSSVGTAEYEAPLPALKSPTIPLFDDVLHLAGSVTPTLGILAGGKLAEKLFDGSSTLAAPAGSSLGKLTVDASITMAGVTKWDYGHVVVSTRASAGASLKICHFTPVRQDVSRLDALALVVRTSRLPQLAEISAVPMATVHQLDALLYIDFGVSAAVGQSFAGKITKELDGLARESFADLPLTLQLSVAASLRAAVGLGLYERMLVTVGRGASGALKKDWVRIRLERARRDTLSFAVAFELGVEYDLGTSLSAIVGRAFDRVPPLTGAAATFRELNKLLAEGDWNKVKAQLSDELADAISDWLDDTGWKTAAEQDGLVKELLAASKAVVKAYEDLGPKLQGWWDDLLGKVELGAGSKLRTRLERLAALDPQSVDLDQLISGKDPQIAELISLIEALSGHSLEEVLLGSDDEARGELNQAVEQAKRALKFLAETPPEVLAKLQEFAKRTGVAGTIDFLAENATSLDQFDSYLKGRVEKVARRLIEKVSGGLSAADLQKVQQAAKKIQSVLDAPEAIEAKLKKAAEKLKGKLGFSLGLEIGRVTERQALIDVEIDRQAEKLHAAVERELREGNVAGILQALDDELRRIGEEEEKQDKDFEPTFVLRQCVFQSRSLRTSTASTMLKIGSLFADERHTVRQWLQETELAVEPRDGDLRREATYAGSYMHTERVNRLTDRTGYGVVIEDAGRSGDLSDPYDEAGAKRLFFEVRFLHEDEGLEPAERIGLNELLTDLGFLDGEIVFANIDDLTADTQFRLTIDLRFPRSTLVRALTGIVEADWNRQFLAAAERWFREKSIWVPAHKPPTVSNGRVLEALMKWKDFQENWTIGT